MFKYLTFDLICCDIFRCLTYVREAAQRAATKSELHKTQIESLLGEKVFHDLPGVFRKLGTLKWVRSSDIAPTGLSKLNRTPSY